MLMKPARAILRPSRLLPLCWLTLRVSDGLPAAPWSARGRSRGPLAVRGGAGQIARVHLRAVGAFCLEWNTGRVGVARSPSLAGPKGALGEASGAWRRRHPMGRGLGVRSASSASQPSPTPPRLARAQASPRSQVSRRNVSEENPTPCPGSKHSRKPMLTGSAARGGAGRRDTSAEFHYEFRRGAGQQGAEARPGLAQASQPSDRRRRGSRRSRRGKSRRHAGGLTGRPRRVRWQVRDAAETLYMQRYEYFCL